VVPCIDAGKEQVYGRVYEVLSGTLKPLGEEDWVVIPELLCELVLETTKPGQAVFGGTGIDRYLNCFLQGGLAGQIMEKVSGPSAAMLGQRALIRFAKGDFNDLENAVPRYGRPPDITKSKKALLNG
jgi:tRNA A37 threonylcarbamoyladenosine modification protein TsaB